MPLSDVIAYCIVALLLVQAVIRLPSALNGRGCRERSLWGAFAALACAWLLRTDLGRGLVGLTGVNDLPTLLKHVITIVGICVLLKYVTGVYRADSPGTPVPPSAQIAAAVHRVAARASVATVLCMTAIFFLALDRSKTAADSPYFMGRHSGEAGLLLYMGLFYLYVAVAAAVCAIQWADAARQARRLIPGKTVRTVAPWNTGAIARARRRAVRTGLAMMATGMVLAVAYALVRLTYLVVITVHSVSDHIVQAQEATTDTLLITSFLLFGLGAIAPATQGVVDQFKAMRALARLHPLWRELALAQPSLALTPPSRLFRGHRAATRLNTCVDLVFRSGSPRVRLGRYVTEIRDVMHQLRRHAPVDLYDRAAHLAEQHGHLGPATAVYAEAYWLKAALTCLAASPRPGAPVRLSTTSGPDLATEVPWLLQVSAAYLRTPDDAATMLLADTATAA